MGNRMDKCIECSDTYTGTTTSGYCFACEETAWELINYYGIPPKAA